jgi:hypothetical protein
VELATLWTKKLGAALKVRVDALMRKLFNEHIKAGNKLTFF